MTIDELTERVIGCAYYVHGQLGAGFLERVYENALRIELTAAGISVKQQQPVNVWYAGELVGDFQVDLLVVNRLIIELKAVENLRKEHEVQLVNYLAAANIDDGLLINFGTSVDIRRKFRRYQRKV